MKLNVNHSNGSGDMWSRHEIQGYYYMTLKCDLDLESGYLSRGFCTVKLREHLGEVYSKQVQRVQEVMVSKSMDQTQN